MWVCTIARMDRTLLARIGILRTGNRAASRTRKEGIASAVAFGLLAYGFDQACENFKQRGLKPQEALGDGAAHIATALAVAAPALPFVGDRRRFLVIAAVSAVAIDLDHVLAARSVSLIPCMTMPHRPPSHSLLTLGALTYLAERAWPGTQTELAIALGLGSHLLRDLATGGAPLFLPRRIVELARPPAAFMIVGLGAFGRWYARHMLDPQRPRRSNQAVLAPEGLMVAARAVRALRRARPGSLAA